MGCGVVRDPDTGEPLEVVTVGGYGGSYTEVEIYDIGTNTWRVSGEFRFLDFLGF